MYAVLAVNIIFTRQIKCLLIYILFQEIKSAMSLSLDWDAKTVSNKFHYTQHNNYGSLQAELFTQNEFLATSSYNYGYKHAANVQNVNISWTNLKNAVRSSLAHSIFGSPLISFPVCGSTDFFPESKESTCTRWYLTAATMPLFRISSLLPRRDPNNLYTVYAQNIAKYAINTRHMLLPYYYSIIKTEELLIRPMFYEFFDDQETHTLDEQYMIGNALLVAQFFYTGASSVRVYLPPSAGTWFEFWGGRSYKNGWININVVERDWIMFLAQGNIVPLQFVSIELLHIVTTEKFRFCNYFDRPNVLFSLTNKISRITFKDNFNVILH